MIMSRENEKLAFRTAFRRSLGRFPRRSRRRFEAAIEEAPEALEILQASLENELLQDPSTEPEQPWTNFVEMLLDRVSRWFQYLVDNADKVAEMLTKIIGAIIAFTGDRDAQFQGVTVTASSSVST